METQEKVKRYVDSIELMHEYPGETIVPDIYIDHLASGSTEIFTLGKPQNWKNDYESDFKFLEILKEKRIKKLYVPQSNTFTGTICDPCDFENEFLVFGTKIMTGCITDGLEISIGCAALILTADCPTVVYHDIKNDVLIAAHAGLGSVVDLSYITTGLKSRSHEGIVDEIMLRTVHSSDYEIFIICGIGYESFIYDPYHPIYGEKNQKILKYLIEEYGENSVPLGFNHGGISINAVIKQQFLNYGICVEKINSDGFNTYVDSRFWSHSRYFKQKLSPCGRNGVLVLHK